MKRRIYLSFAGLILPSLLLLSVLLSVIFYFAIKNQDISSIKDRAVLLSEVLNAGEWGGFQLDDYLSHTPDSARITIIAADGSVLLDSKADAKSMENHGGRIEFTDALQKGTGESLRYSDTMSAETFYFALRLDSGDVLRVSKPVSSIAGAFALSLPAAVAVTLLVLLAADFAARRLTRRIIEPLGDIEYDGASEAVYEELLPYVKRINRQRNEIDEQFAALRERADTISAITANMREGIILIDKNGVALSANNGAQALFGELERKNILHICRDADFRRGVRLCLGGENAELLIERNGKSYNVFFSPVYSGGVVGGAVILFWDTTEMQKAEKQRREFSANVSHELKTPLTTISAISEMIESGMAAESDIKSFAARISEQARRLLCVIDDIIKLSEFDEGRIQREYADFDLYELAETVTAAFSDNVQGVDLRVEGERFEVCANKRMIDELLYNLVDNGVKYNKDGGRVTIELSTEGRFAKIEVSDAGIGIPEEHLARVFERFYRFDKSRSKKTGGTGLGLSIVKHIAEYHGGRADISSSEAAGTTVTCYILLQHK